MGQVCAKSDAGRMSTTEGPQPKLKRNEKDLMSSQSQNKPDLTAGKAETKFIASTMNFKTDKGVEVKADDLARTQANEWCAANPGWEYSGVWKNERTEDGQGEISHFEVRK